MAMGAQEASDLYWMLQALLQADGHFVTCGFKGCTCGRAGEIQKSSLGGK